MDSNLFAHYEAVLRAERAARERLCGEIRRLNQSLKQKDALIAGLASTLAADDASMRAQAEPLPFAQPVGLGAPAESRVPDNHKFAGISVRWSILSLMADHVPPEDDLGTVEMAEALQSGGVRSGGQNFAANVSAVVSDMVNKRQELEPTGNGKYRITQTGRSAWQTIKMSRQYRSRRSGWTD
jgi:hypothetical protein